MVEIPVELILTSLLPTVLHLMPRHPVLQHVDRAPLEDEESVGLRSLHYDVLTWEDEQDVHSFGDRTARM